MNFTGRSLEIIRYPTFRRPQMHRIGSCDEETDFTEGAALLSYIICRQRRAVVCVRHQNHHFILCCGIWDSYEADDYCGRCAVATNDTAMSRPKFRTGFCRRHVCLSCTTAHWV